jgi:uncharacterized membrane protein YbaN (DUF454 family)
MYIFLSALAVLFLILGFVGFALGGLPTLVFWILAGVCLAGAWKMRSGRQRRHENRNLEPGTRV